MEVLRQPVWPYSSFFAINAQPLNQYPAPATTKKAKKRKNRKTPEQEESEVSTVLTKKPRTSETTFTATSPIEKNPVVKEVSTELTLFDESWITKKRNSMEESAHNSAYTSRNKESLSKDALEAELNKAVVICRISAMKYYNPKEKQEERLMGFSTNLKLYENPFKIKKKLTKSDLGNLCRLLVKTSLVKEHILPYFPDRVNEIESDEGARVVVWDQDTQSVHQLIFKQWSTSKSYVFIDKWTQDFVHRRDLKKGDDIGLYWDPYYSRFNFCVLKRAPRNQLAV